eukprot:8618004-Pyramimonas_sp.AAC.1
MRFNVRKADEFMVHTPALQPIMKLDAFQAVELTVKKGARAARGLTCKRSARGATCKTTDGVIKSGLVAR